MGFLNGASAGEALLFSAVAYLVPLLLGWWLFGSRVALPVGGGGGGATVPARQAGVLAVLLGLAGLSLTAGGLWDAMKHVQTGDVPAGADFLWAPHIMIYASFLAIFGVALYTVGVLAVQGRRAGMRDVRLWMRKNPGLGALALAALYALLSVPGDAIWHEIFGPDLTAWSIPHVALGVSSAAVNVSALALVLRSGVMRGRDLLVAAFLAVVLNLLAMLGVLEWETPGSALNGYVLARPVWLYPVVFGALAFVVVRVGQALIPRWGATVTALAGYGLRAALTAILGAAGYPMPHFLPVMLLGAVLLDLVPWPRWKGVAFAVGYLVVALPQLMGRSGLPPFALGDVVWAMVGTVVVVVALTPAADSVGARLEGSNVR